MNIIEYDEKGREHKIKHIDSDDRYDGYYINEYDENNNLKMAYLVYNKLSLHIGSSIKNMLLGEKVADMNQQLKRTNEQKTQFFINIAHETRTPLTLIRNYLALYLEQHKPDEKLLIVKQNIDLLVVNMLNFLDVEKLQKDEMIYHHDKLVDLSKSARSKYPLFQAMAVKKKGRILLNLKDHVVIRIDPWKKCTMYS